MKFLKELFSGDLFQKITLGVLALIILMITVGLMAYFIQFLLFLLLFTILSLLTGHYIVVLTKRKKKR